MPTVWYEPGAVSAEAQSVSSQWDRLKITLLPAIAQHTDGHFCHPCRLPDDRS